MCSLAQKYANTNWPAIRSYWLKFTCSRNVRGCLSQPKGLGQWDTDIDSFVSGKGNFPTPKDAKTFFDWLLTEHLTFNQVVAGSRPARPTNPNYSTPENKGYLRTSSDNFQMTIQATKSPVKLNITHPILVVIFD